MSLYCSGLWGHETFRWPSHRGRVEGCIGVLDKHETKLNQIGAYAAHTYRAGMCLTVIVSKTAAQSRPGCRLQSLKLSNHQSSVART